MLSVDFWLSLKAQVEVTQTASRHSGVFDTAPFSAL
jgi:hypothetical protein